MNEFILGFTKRAQEKGLSEEQAIKLAGILGNVLRRPGEFRPPSRSFISPEMMQNFRKGNPAAIPSKYLQNTPAEFPQASLGTSAPLSEHAAIGGYMEQQAAEQAKMQQLAMQQAGIRSRLQRMQSRPTEEFSDQHSPFGAIPNPPAPIKPISMPPPPNYGTNTQSRFSPNQQALAAAQQTVKMGQALIPLFPKVMKPMVPAVPHIAPVSMPQAPKPSNFMSAQQGIKDVNNPRLGGAVIQPSLSDQIRFNRQYSNA